MNLTGNALGTIKNMIQEKEVNGVLGWWKLGKEVNAMAAQRLQGLAGKVYSPKRAKKYSEISAAVETWEMDVRLFEKAEGKTISDQTRLYAIRQIFQRTLRKTSSRATP